MYRRVIVYVKEKDEYAIALFGADQHDEASLLLKELTTACPNADTRTCHRASISTCSAGNQKPCMAHVTTKQLSISLPPSIAALYHRNWTCIIYTRTWKLVVLFG
ncbi:hypothetical protein BDR07DRAFT_1007968 [Suillus spraguei]|nr:hypothetical protein BDR07DRAFT_1007968 [Suillus spraguei]